MINQASYNQYELEGNTLVESSTCYEKGNSYFSERMDAAIYSDNLITAEMDPTNKDAINGGEGVTYMTGDYGMPGANARIVITGRPYGKSSAAQNTVHEFVSHAIPFIIGDRPQGASALEEERRAIKGVSILLYCLHIIADFALQADIRDNAKSGFRIDARHISRIRVTVWVSVFYIK